MVAVVVCVATAVVFFMLGWACAPTKIVAPEQLATYMARLVNAEGYEQRRMEVRRVLHRADRRTMRNDGGPPARVHRLRTYKRATRY
jgi:hypothetical protein